MNKVIPIQTSEKDFFYNYLRILTPVINKVCQLLSGDICYLRDAEIKIIADLMYYYSIAPQKTPLEKNQYIFGFDVTNVIMDKYNINVYNYNNLIGRLRKFGVIQGKRKSRVLHPIFYMEPFAESGYEVTIKFIYGKS